MRLKQLALLLAPAAVMISGCSTARSLTASLPAQNGHQSSASDYDSDPPAVAGRTAIQPNPVPPARGVSHVRGISFLKILGYGKSDCADESCAPQAACNVPAQPCAPEPVCDEPVCGETTGGSCLSRLFHFSKHQDCGAEPECCDSAADTCTPDTGCGDSNCRKSWYGCRLFCPPPKPVCVTEERCGESYCQPLATDCCDEDPCCEEGCNSKSRGLLTCLLDKLRYNPWQPHPSQCGDLCTPVTEPSCGAPSCGAEGCDDNACTDNSDLQHCRPASPLADRLADPFVNPETESQPKAAPGAVPSPPAFVPGEGKKSSDQPVRDLQPEPLSPVPGTPDQAVIEPQVWPKLKMNRVASQGQNAYSTHPTGWGRY